jgi:hypothetical protein
MVNRDGYEDCYFREPTIFPYTTRKAIEIIRIVERAYATKDKDIRSRAFHLINELVHEVYMQGREDG